MTAANTAVAATEMEKLFSDVWLPRAIDLPNKTMVQNTPESEAWARWRLQHATAGQRTFAGHDRKRKFERTGSVIIQVFAPLNVGIKAAYEFADIAINAYEGKRTPSDVWFREVRAVEVGNATSVTGDTQSGSWYQINVYADFVYDVYK